MISRTHARSMVVSRRGIVATEHPLASQAGATILAHGGHAVDAAVAANAVMGVVCPMMCGIGGDLFAIVWDHGGQPQGLNASGWAPAGLTIELLKSLRAEGMPQSGVHSITVPGAVAGWAQLLGRFGKKTFADVLAPAIAIADEGFPVAEITAEEWTNAESFLRGDIGATKTFLPMRRALKVGEVFENRELASAYKAIAAGGRDGFYRGEISQRMIDYMRARGGTMNQDDLSSFDAEWIAPISTVYRGWRVFEIPPNGAGIAALMMLNLLEHFPLAEYGPSSEKALHTIIEAKKIAYADMQRYTADQRYAHVPVDVLLSKEFAAERVRALDTQRANESVSAAELPAHAGDTVYLSVVDAQGNMVSLIQSNFASFGSGLVPEGVGFPLQNRGALFTLDPSHPNALAPRKRPLHTIIPAFLDKEDVRIAFGIMGGWNQSQAHAQFVSNVVDHRMNIQQALEAPRVTKLTFEGRDVMVENRIPQSARGGLGAKGHTIEMLGDFATLVGGGQAVMRDFATGVNFGASDPRKDGAAVPEPVT